MQLLVTEMSMVIFTARLAVAMFSGLKQQGKGKKLTQIQ